MRIMGTNGQGFLTVEMSPREWNALEMIAGHVPQRAKRGTAVPRQPSPVLQKVCMICGTAFETKHPHKKTCKPACAREKNLRYLRERYIPRRQAQREARGVTPAARAKRLDAAVRQNVATLTPDQKAKRLEMLKQLGRRDEGGKSWMREYA
jgi:hypothetical protein